MESYQIENLTFTYPNKEKPALYGLNLSVEQGEFITLCGKSGCGKTTLLRLLKTTLAPFGTTEGTIRFLDKPLAEVDAGTQAAKIGFVMQACETQIVTDKVWHELAFGLESLGVSTPEIRTRVAEMASFFGIQTWFHKKVSELSGGQKQLLNLAAVMVMQPAVLILDEPTSQLDPIAAQEFLKTLEKINRELGTTVILSEHRLEDAFPISDRVVVMDSGRIIAAAPPKEVGEILKRSGHDMYAALPAPMRIYGAVASDLPCPLTVREGRAWLEALAETRPLQESLIPEATEGAAGEAVITVQDAHFRYEKDLPDVVKGLNLTINKGELFAIVGGNGTGKTTALSLISGLHSPHRGSVHINGQALARIPNLYNGVLGVLPQNPQSLFVKKTVYLDLLEILPEKGLAQDKKDARIAQIASLCHIEELLECHPYDLSGGEQQRAALAKVLLLRPEILLLDEPTKGMDAHFKELFAEILQSLQDDGTTIVMVSHDIEFCAANADRCAMFFDGGITSIGTPRAFFAGKSFYTTAANRMARTRLPKAVLAEDIVLACGGVLPKKEKKATPPLPTLPKLEEKKRVKTGKLTPKKIIFGCIFALLFAFTSGFWADFYTDWRRDLLQVLSIVEVAVCLFCFLPKTAAPLAVQPRAKRKLSKRTLLATLLALLAIPLTLFIGVFFLEDRRYYFISLLLIVETLIPFCLVFESRRPQARELVIISVLCAIAVVGRAAFFMLPQFKPMVALVIIAGVCFGGETGFLVGAVTGFVSNFFMGQGPWTPWQMFSFGIIGLLAGILFSKGLLRRTKTSLCIFGGLATLLLYGGIMNPASVILWQPNPTAEMFISAYVMGFPFDVIHAASTMFFLWFLAEPMIEKLERVKLKYGLLEK